MTPEQIERASTLLDERNQTVAVINEINGAKRFAIEASRVWKSANYEEREHFQRIGEPMEMTAEVRKLLLTAPNAQLAAIDKELRGLGVVLTAQKTEAVDAAA